MLELLNGGLVTSREPGLLQEGELTVCTNAVYKPESQSLHRGPGYSAFATIVSAGTPLGLANIKYDNATHLLVAHLSTAYYRAAVGDTGTWVAVDTVTAGSYLETATSRNSHFLFNGANANRVWYLKSIITSENPTSRLHGLLPVSEAPVATPADGGTWSQPTTGYFEYWTTEVVKYTKDSTVAPIIVAVASATSGQTGISRSSGSFSGDGVLQGDRIYGSNIPPNTEVLVLGTTTITATRAATGTAAGLSLSFERGAMDELESTFGVDPFDKDVEAPVKPTVAFVPDLTTTVTVQRSGTLSNSNATHWRIYRSPKNATAGDTSFPNGFLVGEAPINTLTWTDKATASATGAPSNSVNIINFTVAHVTALSTSNDNGATAINPLIASQLYSNTYGFTTVADPIVGIKVAIEARKSSGTVNDGSCAMSAQLSWKGSQTWTTTNIQRSVFGCTVAKALGPLSTTDTVFTAGSETDDWGHKWTAAEVNSNNFTVLVQIASPFAFANPSGTIDQIVATIYSAGTSETSVDGGGTKVFPAVQVVFADQSVGVGANGPAPISSTGDVFEDAMVVNDINHPDFIRWSLAGSPDYFPWLYFMRIGNTGETVTCIRTLGNRLLVGTKTSLWRVSYLPTEGDANFQRGKALDLIAPHQGVVNQKCMVPFAGPDGRTRMAFVAHTGLYMTDGYTIEELTPDIRWISPTAIPSGGTSIFSTTTNIFDTGRVWLENNPSNWELQLFVQGTTRTDCYHYSYHPDHIKGTQGRPALKVSGPTTAKLITGGSAAYARASTSVVRTNGTSEIYVGMQGDAAAGGGAVYRRTATNFPHDDGTNAQAAVATRRMMLAGQEGEWQLDRIYVNADAPNTAATLTFYTTDLVVGVADATSSAISPTITTSFVGVHRLDPNVLLHNGRIRFLDAGADSNATWRDWTVNHLTLDALSRGKEEAS